MNNNKTPKFIHIPKTAGSNISQALYGYQVGHKPRSLLRRTDGDFIFAFVRNPLERFVSAFNFLKIGGINAYDENFKVKYLPDGIDINSFTLEFFKTPEIRDWIHFRHQVGFITVDNSLNPYEIDVDFIGHQECFKKDIEKLISFIDVPWGNALRESLKYETNKIKTSSNQVLNKNSRHLLREYYEIDFGVLGYDLIDPRVV